MNSSVRIFFLKLFHWEYWPFGIIQLPLFFMWLWYSLRERSLFYFTASNPGIYGGGMMGESKFDVMELIPEKVKPKTIFVKIPATKEQVLQKLDEAQLKFPVIFKPNLGERGWMVRRMDNENDVIQYLSETKIDFLIQELVTLPLEFGVYYVRFPNEENGFVNSITAKEFLFVEGNGQSTLKELIMQNDRALLQRDLLEQKYQAQWDEVLPRNEKMELVSIGNHCLGTKFLNANSLITPRLSTSFDAISKSINGFYFGRYDLRCASLADLENGNVKIVELNGCGAEPTHIYHPNASLWKGIGDLITHWKNMYRVSKENHQRGVDYFSFREGLSTYKKVKALVEN